MDFYTLLVAVFLFHYNLYDILNIIILGKIKVFSSETRMLENELRRLNPILKILFAENSKPLKRGVFNTFKRVFSFSLDLGDEFGEIIAHFRGFIGFPAIG